MTSPGAPDLRGLVHTFTLPSAEGADLATLNNRMLAEHGLPDKPNAATDPEHFAFWEEALSPGTKAERPVFPWDRPVAVLEATRQRRPRGTSVTLFGGGHVETSRNWSGAYVTPGAGAHRFLMVFGAWKVPEAAVPRVLPGDVDPYNAQYRSATWVGIGGNRSYNSLPQIGTSQNVIVSNGVPTVEYGAWWQWWIKDRPGHADPVPILNFDVKPGDDMLAMLSVEAPWPGDVRFILKNQRTARIVAFKVRAPADIIKLGSSAEWVHERSSDENALFPLPRCTDVQFRHCFALSAADFGEPMSVRRLDSSARLVRMSETFDGPYRSALVSWPRRAGPGKLAIEYREANV